MATQEEIRAELLELARQYFQWKATYFRKEMVDACPTSLIQSIVHDNRRSYTPPSSLAATPDVVDEPWKHKATDIPLRPPPGVGLCDNMMDEQDRRDRQEQMERAIDHAMRSKIK
jgi:hypothetical protein